MDGWLAIRVFPGVGIQESDRVFLTVVKSTLRPGKGFR